VHDYKDNHLTVNKQNPEYFKCILQIFITAQIMDKLSLSLRYLQMFDVYILEASQQMDSASLAACNQIYRGRILDTSIQENWEFTVYISAV
jgi:hypothetical protein